MPSPNPNKNLVIPGATIELYRLTERIGKGGFAEVWSAWDDRLKRVVAVKIIPLAAGDAHNTIQFKREATLITRLEHPHILPLYDFGETPEFRFLVMRYVTGGTLAQRLEHQGLSIREVLRLMMPIATTLDYLHEQRVVHRDLKPANILIDAQAMPYLTDFGLAKALTDTTTPMHSVSGTLTYMPPEQFAGGRLSIQSDQFSFGIMLYQLFTGKLPNKDQVSFGMRQITGKELLPDVTLIKPDLPAGLNDYLRQLTASRPEDRPETVSAVMQGIAGLFHGLTDDTNSATTPSLTLALESAAYRQREAESLLNDSLIAWGKNQFSLSATHYILLNMLLSDLDTLLTPAVRSLMIRGAFEYNMQSKWWLDSPAEVQQRACWHAIRFGNDTARLQALTMALNMPWISQSPLDIIESIGQGLFPISPFTVSALQFLESAMLTQQKWRQPYELALVKVDDNLRQLAISQPTEAAYRGLPARAARLIGLKRRTAAAQKLPLNLKHLDPLLTVYEQAGSLPSDIPALQRLKLAVVLASRELTRRPLEAVQQYMWAAVWNILAFALIILVTGWPRFVDFTQLINHTISYGLLYGLILGVGVWSAHHISNRLVVVSRPIRIALGTLVGGLIIAAAFTLYNQVALDNSIDGMVALYSGLLYVGGFAIGAALPLWGQWVCGTGGVILALLIPWIIYLQTENPPVLDFGDLSAAIVFLLTLAAGAIVALSAFGYRWRAQLAFLQVRAKATKLT